MITIHHVPEIVTIRTVERRTQMRYSASRPKHSKTETTMLQSDNVPGASFLNFEPQGGLGRRGAGQARGQGIARAEAEESVLLAQDVQHPAT